MYFGYDFYYFYAAATLLLNGKDVYDLEQLRQALSVIGRDAGSQVIGFPYPPWTFYLYAPLGFLPFEVALWVWALVQIGVLALSVWLLVGNRQILWARNSLSQGDLFFFSLLFFPSFKLLYCGQITAFGLLGLSFVLSRYAQRSGWLQGGGLALMATKPHLSIPFIVGFCFASSKDRSSLLGGVILGISLQCALSYVVGASSFSAYLIHIGRFLEGSGVLLQPTLFSVLSRVLVLNLSPAWWIVGGVCGGAIFSLSLRSNTSVNRTFLLLTYSLCVAPYAWTHDYILLLPHYLQLVASLKDVVREWVRDVLHLGQFFLFLPTLIWPNWEFASIVFPLCFFIFFRYNRGRAFKANAVLFLSVAL
jgi:Glycosyltransferase family 87